VLLMADAVRRRMPQVAEVHRQLIHNLRESGRLRTTAFITTNYDTLIDNALEDTARAPDPPQQDSPVDYGLNSTEPSLTENSRGTIVPLYKIHGSLNWLYCPVCSDMIVTRGADIITRLQDTMSTARCTHCDTIREPIVVPPTYYKDLSNVYLALVWNNAVKTLREAVHLVFCGYSMPDADMHVKYLIKTAQLNRGSESDPLQITLVNTYAGKNEPDKRSDLDRYSRFFGSSVTDSSKSFEDFAANPSAVLRR